MPGTSTASETPGVVVAVPVCGPAQQNTLPLSTTHAVVLPVEIAVTVPDAGSPAIVGEAR